MTTKNRVVVFLKDTEVEFVKALAKLQGRSVSGMIRFIICKKYDELKKQHEEKKAKALKHPYNCEH